MSNSMGSLIGLLCASVFILGFAAVGVFLIVQSFRSRKKAETSQGWPSTRGQVIESHVSHSTSRDSDGDTSDHYSPKVRYTYQVMGQDFEGNKISFGFQTSYNNPAKAQAALAQYPAGAQVTVTYDPNNPAEAVLERKAGGSTLSLVLGIIFVAVSLCLGCPGLFMLVSSMFSEV